MWGIALESVVRKIFYEIPFWFWRRKARVALVAAGGIKGSAQLVLALGVNLHPRGLSALKSWWCAAGGLIKATVGAASVGAGAVGSCVAATVEKWLADEGC